MKSNYSLSRYTILWVLILCYLIPIVGVLFCETFTSQPLNGITILSLGLFVALLGTLTLFLMMIRWQASLLQKPQRLPAPSSVSEASEKTIHSSISTDDNEYQEIIKALNEALDNNQVLQTQVESLTQQFETLSKIHEQTAKESQYAALELDNYRNASLDQLSQQQCLIRELQDTVAEQKNLLEKKQHQVGQLETKVGDLTYEIKTLLKLAEKYTNFDEAEPVKEPSPSVTHANRLKSDEPIQIQQEKQINTTEEASLQLKRCLDISQKITGSHRFNSHLNMLIDSTVDSYTFDLRRLCDSLRSEKGCAILLYSPKDHQLLFVNNQIKTLTGWNPEKFSQNFSDILVDTVSWKEGISNLAIRNEIQMKLTLKTKTSQEVTVAAHLGIIPTGLFRHHAIAILFQPAETTTRLQTPRMNVRSAV